MTDLKDVEAKDGNMVLWRCFVEALRSKAEKKELPDSRFSEVEQED